MTYNVFGGTLNLAQFNSILFSQAHLTELIAVLKVISDITDAMDSQKIKLLGVRSISHQWSVMFYTLAAGASLNTVQDCIPCFQLCPRLQMADAAMWKSRLSSSVAVILTAGSPHCTDRRPTRPESVVVGTQTYARLVPCQGTSPCTNDDTFWPCWSPVCATWWPGREENSDRTRQTHRPSGTLFLIIYVHRPSPKDSSGVAVA